MMKVLSLFGACTTNTGAMDARQPNDLLTAEDLSQEPSLSSSRIARLALMQKKTKPVHVKEVRLDLPDFFEPRKLVKKSAPKPKRQRPKLTVSVPMSRKTKITDKPRPVPASLPDAPRELHFPAPKARRYRCKRCKRIFHQEMNARAHFFCSRRSGSHSHNHSRRGA